MKGIPVLASLLAAAVSLSVALAAGPSLPAAPQSVEEARSRLRLLGEQAEQVDEWVDENWEKEFADRHPGLSRAPRRSDESLPAYREREMRARMAASDLKKTLREERKAWLGAERRALLDGEIREPLPVRLGAYDADRGEYPLLLGFGWPSGLQVRLKVSEREKEVFRIRFPRSLPASFRINGKGEVYLLSLDRAKVGAEPVVSVAAPGPRLLWQGAHESWVTSVSIRDDGQQALSGGGDGALCAWDVETGNRIWRIDDVEMALSLAYSPDGATFATGGADSNLRLRDVETGKEIWRESAAGMVFSVSFSPDGRHIAAGDDSGILRIVNAQSGKEVFRTDLGAPVRSAAFSPGGMTIAAGTEGNVVVLWEVASGRQLWRTPFEWPVLSVAASPAGGLIAAGGGGSVLRVLRDADGTEAWNAKVDGELRSVRFDPTGRLVGSGGAGYAAKVFVAETGAPLWTAGIGSPVRSIAFGPQGMKLLVGSADFGVRMFEVDEGDRIPAAFGSYGRIYVERSAAARIFR